jgi:hypothetical protein
MKMHTCIAAQALVGLLAAQAPREPLRGSAVLADGGPWTNATVCMLGRPLANDERLGAPDRLAGSADDKGRFTLHLLAGRQYTAWAIEDLGNGRYRASFPVDRVVGGQPLELVADAPRTQQTLKVTGLAPWRQRDKVVARLLSSTQNLVVAEQELAGDSWVLPPMPGRSARLEVLCGTRPLFPWPAVVDLTAAALEPYAVPAPRAVHLRVVDGGQQPVAGAVLALRSWDPSALGRELDTQIARTDRKGDAMVELPLKAGAIDWVNFALGVRAAGFAPVGWIHRLQVPAAHDALHDPPCAVVALRPGTRHALRVHRGAEPLAIDALAITLCDTVGENGFPREAGRLVHTANDGRVDLDRGTDSGIVVLAAVADLGLEPPKTAGPLHAIALVASIDAGEQRPIVDADVEALRPLALVVQGVDGAPAADAQFALVRGGDQPEAVLRGGTDRVGRAAVLTPPDVQLAVVAWSEHGWAVLEGARSGAQSAAQSGAASGGERPLVLRLSAATSIDGSVKGKDGAPVPFAEVQYDLAGTGAVPQLFAAAVGRLEIAVDRAGRFRVPVFPGAQYILHAVVTPDDEHYLGEPDWTAGAAQPERIELDLGKRR